MIDIWAPQATKAMDDIVDYLIDNFGVNSAMKFQQDIEKCRKAICNNPLIAHQEFILEDEPIIYRSYLINKYNKLIYYLYSEIVVVVDIWDTRRDPENLKKRI